MIKAAGILARHLGPVRISLTAEPGISQLTISHGAIAAAAEQTTTRSDRAARFCMTLTRLAAKLDCDRLTLAPMC